LGQPEPSPYRSLFMRRPHLRELPPLALSPGYRLRTAGPADTAGLAALLTLAFGEAWDAELTRHRLIEDPSVAAIYVIEREAGPLVATASSRLLPDQYAGSGYLHWVGGDPAERGQRLGYQVTLAVLHDFARRGLVDSVLETDDWRLPAIATYLKCGYVPELRDPADADRWTAVSFSLGQKGDSLSGRMKVGLIEDAAITGKVKAALLMDERIGATGINVNTVDEVVTLEGAVPSEVQRHLAEDLALLHGARAVRNLLEVTGEPIAAAAGATGSRVRVTTPPGAPPRQGSDLERMVKRALAEDRRVNEHLLDVQVENETVTLSGRQGTVDARDAAIETATHVPGVAGVVDEIEIMPAV
jgi:mycothiol synthase